MLEKAHDVIVEKGWCQRRLHDAEGRVCALGAIQTAVYGAAGVSAGVVVGTLDTNAIGRRLKQYREATEFLFRETDSTPIPDFNDDPGTSKEDVLLLFKRAAERARLEGH